jgi:thiol:disulfide interchange protein
MSQRNIMMIFLVAVTFIFGALLLSEAMSKKTILNKEDNWEWEDKWTGSVEPISKKEIEEPEVEKPEVSPEEPLTQITANSYQEALKISSETGKPVLAFFTSDGCGWCDKMKRETLTDSNVVEAMKSYVFVFVDTSKDRDGVRKFGIVGLPSYVVTNAKEERLKFGSGFMNGINFHNWLTGSKSVTQPRVVFKSTPSFEELIEMRPENIKRRKLRDRLFFN